jgi:hypothetical protein
MKNNAMLSAGKTKPTIGTKIEGKNAAAIFLSKKFLINNYQFIKSMLLIIHEKGYNETRI